MSNMMNVHYELTMSSLDFLDNIINPARTEFGQTAHEPRKFLSKIEDEIGESLTGKKFRLNNNQTQSAYYELDMDQMMLIGMRESKAVRRQVLEKLKALSAPPQMSQAELIAAMAQLNVAQEKRITAVEKQVEQITQGTIPQGYQGYSYLHATFGLSIAKCKQLVMAWSVPHKKVPHVAPGGQVTQMSVVDEYNFQAALTQMMKEAEQRGSQWYHPKMGRFSITDWTNAA